MESGKNKNLILWAGVAAATAGIAAVAAIVKWQERRLNELAESKQLRSVQDVLADCYEKISEIEQHIPEVVPERPKVRRHLHSKPKSNGKPVLES